MTEHARGTFTVQITPADDAPAGIGRMQLAKTWSGDLSGAGHGLMLSAGDPAQQQAGYVALEIFDGTLAGRAGTFAFQQWGTMTPDDQELQYAVVPGSGTGELAGISGRLDLIIADGVHSYDLSYDLPT
jgi:hypothetical protein